MRRAGRALLGGLMIAVAAAQFTGCSGAAPRPNAPITTGATILQSLRAREARVRSLRARGSVDQFGRQGRVRGNITIFLQQPDRVRVDAFAFGNLISSMIMNGPRFTLLQGTEYVTGPTRACAVAQLLGIAMEPREILAVLSGGPPLISEEIPAPSWEGGRYVVNLSGADGARERLEFEVTDATRNLPPDQQALRVRRVTLSDRQGLRAEVTYEGYRDVQGTAFPDRVRVVMPREQGDTMLRFDEVQPNYTIEPDPMNPGAPTPDPFEQTRPNGVTEVPIQC